MIRNDKIEGQNEKEYECLKQQIEEMALGLMITKQSLDHIQKEHSEINIKSVLDSFFSGYELLVENLVVLTSKKYHIQLPQNLLAEQNPYMQINFGMQKCGKIFANKIALDVAIDLLPKGEKTTLNGIMEMSCKNVRGNQKISLRMNFLRLFILLFVMSKKIFRNFFGLQDMNAKNSLRQIQLLVNIKKMYQIIYCLLCLQTVSCFWLGTFMILNFIMSFIKSSRNYNKINKYESCSVQYNVYYTQCLDKMILQEEFIEENKALIEELKLM